MNTESPEIRTVSLCAERADEKSRLAAAQERLQQSQVQLAQLKDYSEELGRRLASVPQGPVDTTGLAVLPCPAYEPPAVADGTQKDVLKTVGGDSWVKTILKVFFLAPLLVALITGVIRFVIPQPDLIMNILFYPLWIGTAYLLCKSQIDEARAASKYNKDLPRLVEEGKGQIAQYNAQYGQMVEEWRSSAPQEIQSRIAACEREASDAQSEIDAVNARITELEGQLVDLGVLPPRFWDKAATVRDDVLNGADLYSLLQD